MRTLNLGILAHVDAGKTTLTERILFAAGVIDRLGSVDDGTTQTDSLALERERGITIRSAVVSFTIGNLAVNLIDTPGHPDFIAEVERALSVLDGAVLVLSAVEGVQPQTPLLMRALQRLHIPTLIFVNKIDRAGADDGRTLRAIARRLTPAILPMVGVDGIGTADAAPSPAGDEQVAFHEALLELVADRDDAILAAYVEGDRPVSDRRLHNLLRRQTKRALIHPVFFGSALTGTGVHALMVGIEDLLPGIRAHPGGDLSGRVFKIERTASGARVAYIRLFSGTLRLRDRAPYGAGAEGRVTELHAFRPGGPVPSAWASAPEIAKVFGLADIRIGDHVGERPLTTPEHYFTPPTLEAVVVPRRVADRGHLSAALAELAEQDPLINVRQDDASGEISVSLYGEVQKEVIGATLARDYGVEVAFRETTTIYIERPIGTGQALEVIRAATHSNIAGKSSPYSTNPFGATLGLRIEPAPPGSGINLRLDVDAQLVPLRVYKTSTDFVEQMHLYVREALQEGLAGWEVTDCNVTITDCGYRRGGTTAADFHRLTRLVVMLALERAGTEVCEPMASVRLELPAHALKRVLPLLARLGARVEISTSDGYSSDVRALLAAARADNLRRALPGLTGGEGVLEVALAGYQPVAGPPPIRRPATPHL